MTSCRACRLVFIHHSHGCGSGGPLRSRLLTFDYSGSPEFHLKQPNGCPGPCRAVPGRAGPAGAAASSGETADVEAMEFGRERLVL